MKEDYNWLKAGPILQLNQQPFNTAISCSSPAFVILIINRGVQSSQWPKYIESTNSFVLETSGQDLLFVFLAKLPFSFEDDSKMSTFFLFSRRIEAAYDNNVCQPVCSPACRELFQSDGNTIF